MEGGELGEENIPLRWKSTWKTSNRVNYRGCFRPECGRSRRRWLCQLACGASAGKPRPCLRLASKRGHEAGLIAGLPCLLPRSPSEPLVPPRHHAAPSARRPISAPPGGPFPHRMRAPAGRGEAAKRDGMRPPSWWRPLPAPPASRAVGRRGSSPTSRTVTQDKDKRCSPFFPPASSLLFLAFTGWGNGGGRQHLEIGPAESCPVPQTGPASE